MKCYSMLCVTDVIRMMLSLCDPVFPLKWGLFHPIILVSCILNSASRGLEVLREGWWKSFPPAVCWIPAGVSGGEISAHLGGGHQTLRRPHNLTHMNSQARAQRDSDGKDLQSGMLHESHILQHGWSTQMRTPCYHDLANSTSRMPLDLKCFTEKEKGRKHLTFSKQLKEPALLYLKAQENPSSPLLLEAFKNGSMTVWIHISCWYKWVLLHWASEGLSLVHTDSFLNAANSKQLIFLCLDCRV